MKCLSWWRWTCRDQVKERSRKLLEKTEVGYYFICL